MINSDKDVQNFSEPVNTLEEFIGKFIIVKLKNNDSIQGKLKHFDQHMNLFLTDTDVKTTKDTKQFNDIVLRGSNVLAISLGHNSASNNEGNRI